MKEKRAALFIFLATVAVCTLITQGCGDHGNLPVSHAGDMPGYDQYSNEQYGISLSKPKGWNVAVSGSVITISETPNSSSGIFLLPILRADPKIEAVSFLRFMYDQARVEHPDLKVEARRSDRNNTFAEVTTSYVNNKTKEEIRGFFMVSIEQGQGIFCGYEAPADTFDREHTVLKNIAKNLRITPRPFSKAAGTNTTAGDLSRKTPAPTIDISKLTTKLSADRTMYMAVPSDWTVGGGNYSLIATPPGEKMGVTATNDAQPATRDPQTYLMKALMPFYGCSSTVIHKKEPNQDLMRFSRSQGYSSQAENFTGETTQKNGQKVTFWIMVNAATLPHGGGFVSTLGFFAVPELFDRNASVLFAMASSMGPNQQEIMGRLRENLDRLGQASRTIAATGDLVIQGQRSRTANWDRALDKYNYYLSGEEARYSPLENKIYVVDSRLEKYAGNPRYPQEMLSDVPDHLWNKLPHQRKTE